MDKNKQTTPLPQENDPFEEAGATPPTAQQYPVTVDGETVQLTLEQLTEAAAAGLSRRDESARLGHAAAQVPSGEIYAAFVREYPSVKPTDIPESVWQDAQAENSLVSAYRKWENENMRAKLAALEKNSLNRESAVGSATGDGEPAGYDPVAAALLA